MVLSQERLVDVRKVVASYGAFCALTSRGVVGWGDESFGAEVEGSWEAENMDFSMA